MRLLKIILLLVSCAALGVRAQDTNVITFYTKLEAFEAQTERIIIKAWGEIGSVSAQTAVISVNCREATDIASGAKEYGVVIGIKRANHLDRRIVVDYDELDSVLAAIDYIARVDLSATSLPSFQAIYRTRSDLRLLAYNSTQRTGTVQALQTGYDSESDRIAIRPNELTDFKVLIRGAKEKLDELKKNGT